MIQPQQVFEHPPVNFSPSCSQRVGYWRRLAGTGILPNFGPGFVPLPGWVGGGVGGEDGFIQLLVREFQPGGAFVVEVRQRPLLEARVFGGGGEDGRAADEGAGVGRDVGEIVGGVDPGGQRIDPLRRVQATSRAARPAPWRRRRRGRRRGVSRPPYRGARGMGTCRSNCRCCRSDRYRRHAMSR